MMTIYQNDPLYPQQLKRLTDFPNHLFYQGNSDFLNYNYISVVGSREAQGWVNEWLENEMLPVLKKLNVGIISGGARGVDQLSHRLSLRAQQPTLIVLPSGLDCKYPASLKALENNKLVSFITEYETNEVMKKHFFYKRNRLIAGLSYLTLVLQARERSGTMITACYARDCGSVVATIPGNPLDVNMEGNNQLLFEGAAMIRNSNDLEQLIISSSFYVKNKEI